MNENHRLLEQRVAELEEIHKLAESLNSIVGVYQTLEAIAECGLKLCNADRVAVVLLSPSMDESAQTVVRGRSEANGIDHRINSLLAGWVSTKRQILRTSDVLAELSIKNPPQEMQNHDPALAVPLNVRGEPIGVLNLLNTRGRRKFSDVDVRNAVVLGPLAAHFIHNARMQESLFSENMRLKEQLKQQSDAFLILGSSEAIQRVRETIDRVAVTNATVLLIGETGTGKELAARALHDRSPRAAKPFIAINCAAIPETLVESDLFGYERGAFTGATATVQGKFELAHEGTLFLDEISAMPRDLQAKLLRVLETKSFSRVGSTVELRVDVRIIAATNKDLRKAVDAGEFREDLYHRVNVVPIQLPPLRDRLEDIPFLAKTFLEQFSENTKRFTADALEILSKMEWRGNVRELRNIVERVSILTPSADVTEADLRILEIGIEVGTSTDHAAFLQGLLRSHDGSQDLLEIVEQDLLQLALRQTGGNVSQAARLLGIDRNALQRRIQKYHMVVNG